MAETEIEIIELKLKLWVLENLVCHLSAALLRNTSVAQQQLILEEILEENKRTVTPLTPAQRDLLTPEQQDYDPESPADVLSKEPGPAWGEMRRFTPRSRPTPAAGAVFRPIGKEAAGEGGPSQ